MKTWLLIDVSYLCHRVWHTLPKLTWKGKPSETIYGFFQSIMRLRNYFGTDDLVFCFDHQKNFRKEIFPDYKKRRHTKQVDPAEVQALRELHTQIDVLRLRHLPEAGFPNVFCYPGLESDDILAAIAMTGARQGTDEYVIVTADSDLYQCLAHNVSMYSPQNEHLRTVKWFKKTYRIKPKLWSMVKALGGCKSDQVPGIRGIGEITALKYIRGELDRSHRAYGLIRSHAGQKIVDRNLTLVRLPWQDCPVPKLKSQGWNPEKVNRVLHDLGIRPRI